MREPRNVPSLSQRSQPHPVHSIGEVHALRGPGFTSVQFHPESVLTEHGPRLIRGLVTAALRPDARLADRVPDA